MANEAVFESNQNQHVLFQAVTFYKEHHFVKVTQNKRTFWFQVVVKPWRQKGTGRSSRIHPFTTMAWRWNCIRTYTTQLQLQMPRKMRRLALRSALSSKVAANEVFIRVYHLDTIKTKTFKEMLSNLA